MIIVEGKKIASEILSGLKSRLEEAVRSGLRPRLVVFLIGEDPSSKTYVAIKRKKAEELGIAVEVKQYPAAIDQDEVTKDVRQIQAEKDVCGILIQLPLPEQFDKQKLLDTIDSRLDVDCLTSENKQRLNDAEPLFVPPAAAAILRIFEHYGIDLSNKNILLVGSGDLVGKPLSALLLRQNISFKIANKYTENLSELCRQADVIISGVGKPGLINGEMIKPGVVLIDAGTTGSETGGGIRGDIDTESVKSKAEMIAPVPGGVGPITLAMLFSNVVKAAGDKIS